MTPYDILGVTHNASPGDIRRAYRLKAKQLHPDRAGDTPDAHERFVVLRAAYEILGDPQKRQEYDRNPQGIFENEVEASRRRAQRQRRRDRLKRLYD